MNTKEMLKDYLPPIALRGIQQILRLVSRTQSEYQYCPLGWPSTCTGGWDTETVAEAYMKGWENYLTKLESTAPWDMTIVNAPPIIPNDYYHQNMRLVFLYGLTRASWGNEKLRVLDYGGGLGHFYPLARNTLPSLDLDWTVKDVPRLCEVGRRLLPKVSFVSRDEEAFYNQKYSFVLASGVIQYIEDWHGVLSELTRVTNGLLLITRLPICHRNEDFVLVQRSYGTDYPGWVFNRSRFLHYLESKCGMKLLREFLVFPGSLVDDAPDEHEQRAFLFQTTIGRTHE